MNKGEIKDFAGKGIWAILDQGLFATSNFLLNILLARLLTPKEYGAFVVAFTVFWMLATIHTAFLSQPMLVFGSGRYGKDYPSYFRVILYGHFSLCFIVSILLFVSGFISQSQGLNLLALSLWVLALTGPLILFQSLMRKVCYVLLKPYLAAYAGGLYFIVILLGAYLLSQREWLSTPSILVLMGMGNLISSILLTAFLWSTLAVNLGQVTLGRDALKRHWEYGKWAFGNDLMGWIPGNLFNILLPIWGGLEASALFRALTNLILLPLHLLTALAHTLVPTFVRIRERSDFSMLVLKLMGTLLFLGFGYWLILGLFGSPILSWIYEGKFSQNPELLWIIGLVPIFHCMSVVYSVFYLSHEQPRIIFTAFVCSTAMVLLPGVALTAELGVLGAAIGMAASYAVAAIALTTAYIKKHPHTLTETRG